MTAPHPNQDVIIYQPAQKMREIFNQSQIAGDIASGRLNEHVVRSNHLKQPEQIGEPYCTHSQYIRYFDGHGRLQAALHQYMRQDGTLGASGKSDPKTLRIGSNMLLRVEGG